MQVFMIKDEGVVYRVRKEENGCSIFTPTKYIEGNESLLEILQLINEKGVTAAVSTLESRYPDEKTQIQSDLVEFATFFAEKGILPDTCKQILEICRTRSQII